MNHPVMHDVGNTQQYSAAPHPPAPRPLRCAASSTSSWCTRTAPLACTTTVGDAGRGRRHSSGRADCWRDSGRCLRWRRCK